MICGEETNEKVKLVNYYGEWLPVRENQQKVNVGPNYLNGGPLNGVDINSLNDGDIVYVGTPEAAAEYEAAETAKEEVVNTPTDASTEEKIESCCKWAVDIANDNSHGYSQVVRFGPSYDCSSFVISAWEKAGVPVKEHGASYTGNMRSAFLQCGFKIATGVALSTGFGLKRGDVLLNDASHTALYLGNGKVVHARSGEGTTDTIDNSGNEIRTQSYWNYPWSCVLRLQ